MPVLTDEDVGLGGSKVLTDADVGLSPTGGQSEISKAADSMEDTQALIHSTRQAQREAAETEGKRASVLLGLAGAGETAVDVLARTRPDIVARQALGLAGKGVGALLDVIPGIPKKPEGAPDLTQQPVLSPEQAEKAINVLVGPAPLGSVGEGVRKAAAGMASSLTDPATAFSMGPVAEVPALAKPLFALPMIGEIPSAAERLRTAQTTPEQVQAGLELAANIALPAAIERGLRTPPRMPPEVRMGEPRPIPFPAEATVQDIAESQRRAAYIAEQKAALEPPVVTEETLSRLEQEAKAPEATPKPVEATPQPSTEPPKEAAPSEAKPNEITTTKPNALPSVPSGERLAIAVRFPNGEIQKGRPDERMHAQIYARLLQEDHPNLISASDPDVESGWVDSKGNFFTNEQVQKAVGFKPDSFKSGGIQIPEPPKEAAPRKEIQSNRFGADPVWLSELFKPENSDIAELWKSYQDTGNEFARWLLSGGQRGLHSNLYEIRELIREYPSVVKKALPKEAAPSEGKPEVRTLNRQFGELPKGTEVTLTGEKGIVSGEIEVVLPDGTKRNLPAEWLTSKSAAPKETLPAIVKRLGRDEVDRLIGEWDSNAKLSEDGKTIDTFDDARNRTGKTKGSVRDFQNWLASEAAKPTPLAEAGKKEAKPKKPSKGTEEKGVEEFRQLYEKANSGEPLTEGEISASVANLTEPQQQKLAGAIGIVRRIFEKQQGLPERLQRFSKFDDRPLEVGEEPTEITTKSESPTPPAKAQAEVTRTTPAEGSPERAQMEADYKRLHDPIQELYEKIAKLTIERDNSTRFSKKWETLDKRIDKLREQRDALDNSPELKALKEKFRKAHLEDRLESLNPITVAKAKGDMGDRNAYDRAKTDFVSEAKRQGFSDQDANKMFLDAWSYTIDEPLGLTDLVKKRGEMIRADQASESAKAEIESIPELSDSERRNAIALADNERYRPENIQKELTRLKGLSETRLAERASKAKATEQAKDQQQIELAQRIKDQPESDWDTFARDEAKQQFAQLTLAKKAYESLSATDKARAKIYRTISGGKPRWSIWLTRDAALKWADEKLKPKPQQPAQPPAATEGPTVVSGAPPSPSALGVSPASLSISMSVNPKLVPAIRGTLKTVSGETMPKTTMANREAGEAGARYGSSPFYAHYAARALSESVLPYGPKPLIGRITKRVIDPAQFGAALTEDALRGRRQEFLRKAAAATDPNEAAKFIDMANNVGTTVGRFGVFRDEAALQAFVRQPDVLAAVDRLKQLYASNLDPLATQAGLDITKKPQGGGLFPGTFINLFVPQEGGLPSRTTVKTRPVGEIPEAGPQGPSSGVPRLTATMKKRSRFGLQRTGASEIYGVDFHDMVANAFGGFTEIARKNEFDKALVDAGLAKIQQESPGQGWTHFPYEKKQILGLDEGDVAWRKSINKGVWVRNDIAGEYSRVSNVYRNPFSNTATRFLLDAVNKFQMLGILDATFHSSALLRRLWEAPLGKADTALSLLRPADIARRLSMVAENIFQDRLAKNAKLAELANIGALTGHGQIKSHQIVRRTVNFLEENIRLTLSDMYDKLVDEGYPDTETARREYINAGLQYNKRFQGPVVQFLRNFGVGPFVTAGRAGLARGIRRWFLQDWIPGQDAPSQAWTAANVLTKMAGTALLVGTINHLVTGKWAGRPGTPLGNVDTGKDDEKTGRPLSVPLANLMGSEMRGARALGLKAVAEGLRDNAPLSQVIDSAYKDSFNAISHPGIGPAAQAIYGLTYGKPTAIGAPEYPKVAPGSGRSQTLSNAGHAFEELNPMIVRAGRNLVSWATGGKVEPSEEGPMERVKGVAVQKGQKPMEPEEKQQMITFAQLRKYTDYLTSQARQLPREKRLDYILEQFDKDKLGEDFRAKALEQIKRHGVLKYD